MEQKERLEEVGDAERGSDECDWTRELELVIGGSRMTVRLARLLTKAEGDESGEGAKSKEEVEGTKVAKGSGGSKEAMPLSMDAKGGCMAGEEATQLGASDGGKAGAKLGAIGRAGGHDKEAGLFGSEAGGRTGAECNVEETRCTDVGGWTEGKTGQGR
jgi:hypothetical protein